MGDAGAVRGDAAANNYVGPAATTRLKALYRCLGHKAAGSRAGLTCLLAETPPFATMTCFYSASALFQHPRAQTLLGINLLPRAKTLPVTPLPGSVDFGGAQLAFTGPLQVCPIKVSQTINSEWFTKSCIISPRPKTLLCFQVLYLLCCPPAICDFYGHIFSLSFFLNFFPFHSAVEKPIQIGNIKHTRQSEAGYIKIFLDVQSRKRAV